MTTYAALSTVIETDLEGELILLDPRTQEMFSLNQTGRTIWRALPATADALVALVTDAFDVSPDVAEADVRRLLGDLLSAGLIEERDDGAGGAA